MKGFLGPDEKLVQILAEDNRYVVDELGLSHQDLARPLHVMGEVGDYSDKPQEFHYYGRRFEVWIFAYKGDQLSPFYDDTGTSRDAIVKNLDNGKEIKYSLLVPHMIERYGFYEGKGTPYRVEPRQVVAVFDFLTAASDGAAPEGKPADISRVRVWRAVALASFLTLVAIVLWLRFIGFRLSGKRAVDKPSS